MIPHANQQISSAKTFTHHDGEPIKVHFEFYVDAGRHPAFPNPSCEIAIAHGKRDAVVPLTTSQRFVELETLGKEREVARGTYKPKRRLIQVEDGHDLIVTLPDITKHVVQVFDLANLNPEQLDREQKTTNKKGAKL